MNKELEELKNYCYKYIEKNYGIKQNYIRKTKITKNGLFIYGHKCFAPRYCLHYTIKTFLNWYDMNDFNYINDVLDYFVIDCKRLKECD